jgi:hypothetical protein
VAAFIFSSSADHKAMTLFAASTAPTIYGETMRNGLKPTFVLLPMKKAAVKRVMSEARRSHSAGMS